jgi:hypothetical protein
MKFGDSGDIEEFWHEDFVFIILFYFIYLMLNNYFLIWISSCPLNIV